MKGKGCVAGGGAEDGVSAVVVLERGVEFPEAMLVVLGGEARGDLGQLIFGVVENVGEMDLGVTDDMKAGVGDDVIR